MPKLDGGGAMAGLAPPPGSATGLDVYPQLGIHCGMRQAYIVATVTVHQCDSVTENNRTVLHPNKQYDLYEFCKFRLRIVFVD